MLRFCRFMVGIKLAKINLVFQSSILHSRMRHTFVTNLILLLALNLLVKPFYILGIEAEIQNRVGPEIFGSYFALINFSFLLNILPDMGTSNWNTRHIAQNNHLLGKHFSRIFTLRLVLSAVYLVVIGLAAWLLNYSAQQLGILALLALCQLFACMIIYLRSNLTGMHLFKQDSLISVMDRALLVLMMALLLWGNFAGSQFKIEWLVYGQTIAYGLTCFTALFFVVRKSGVLKLDWNAPFSVSVIKQSTPYAALIFISAIAYRLDTVMLERLQGQQQAGVYAMSFRFFEAVNMISYLFAVLLLPLYARMLKQRQDVGSLVRLGFQIMFCGIFIVAVTSGFYGKEILNLFYDHVEHGSSQTLFLLMCSSLFFSLQYIFGTLITASGKLKPLIMIAALGLVFNIILNSVLIPQQGPGGAALASCITQLVVLLAQIVLVQRLHTVANMGLLILQTLVFAVLCIAYGYFLTWNTINPASVVWSVGLYAAGCLLIAAITGMLSIKRFVTMLRQQP
jgi:O-antigen/teichoic acid export membrane protein